jgi:hypothetical protein
MEGRWVGRLRRLIPVVRWVRPGTLARGQRPRLVALERAGACFERGRLVERLAPNMAAKPRTAGQPDQDLRVRRAAAGVACRRQQRHSVGFAKVVVPVCWAVSSVAAAPGGSSKL